MVCSISLLSFHSAALAFHDLSLAGVDVIGAVRWNAGRVHGWVLVFEGMDLSLCWVRDWV